MLLKSGADVNSVDDTFENSALLLACLRSSQASLKVLLEHNAAINHQNKHGDSALHKVIELPTLLSSITANAVVR